MGTVGYLLQLQRPLSCRLCVIAAMLITFPCQAALMPSFQVSGNVGYELAGIAAPGPPVHGNITLSNIPLGAQIQQVFIYTNDFWSGFSGGGQIDATLTPPVGPPVNIANNLSPFSSDPVPTAQTFGYKMGAPPLSVTGNGSYGISITPSIVGGNANQMAGAAMLVIYSDPSLPQRTITVNEGVFLMGTNGQSNSNTTTFTQQTDTIHASANSQLSILTFADDFQSGTSELIKFNGQTVGGPIDANLPGGGSASIFNIPVTSLAGSVNTATVTSTGDIFGWHLAVLQTTAVPEPSTFLLAALGLTGLMLLAQACRRPQ